MNDRVKKLIWDALLRRSWWVYAFAFICLFSYNHFGGKKKQEIEVLQNKLTSLEAKRDHALNCKEGLQIQICSQSDPSWIELILMKQLGVVPDGYLKIHFKKE